ncbi:MAG: RloB family protein [Acidimicrobiaceae bacterium]|nr:RloB family protein [Acidimicrobiia bacterium]MCY4492869.1 RloB family protein [Acidimicrobiaceae bacterium]
MTRSRSRRSPRKDKPTPAIAKKQIYVFCEGERTEPDYIKHWQREYRHQVVVVIDDFHGAPLQLVNNAIDRRKDDLREERRRRGRAFDEYWCIFDRDEHTDFDSAVSRAESKDIRVAHTNPCIELWFILHFVNQTAFIDRHEAQQRSNVLLGCKKRLTRDALVQLRADFDSARTRAQALDQKHDLDGTAPRANPSSSVWCLIEAIVDG